MPGLDLTGLQELLGFPGHLNLWYATINEAEIENGLSTKVGE